MESLIETSIRFSGKVWVFSCILISLIHGERPKCTGDEAHEVGYLRDTCVELARHLHVKLGLSEETAPCKKLAETRTSTLTWPNTRNCAGRKTDEEKAYTRISKLTWLNCSWKKRKRTDDDKVDIKVKKRALAMLVHFNAEVCKKTGITEIEDQKFMTEYIDDVVRRLLESNAVQETSDIIKQIKQLKTTYCRNYYDQQTREANEAAALRRMNEVEATQLTENQQTVKGGEEEADDKSIHVEHIDLLAESQTDSKVVSLETTNADTCANKPEEELRKPITAEEHREALEEFARQRRQLYGSKHDPSVNSGSPQGHQEAETEKISNNEVTSNPEHSNDIDEEEQLLLKQAYEKKKLAEMKMAAAFKYEEITFNYDQKLPLHETVFKGNAGRLAFLLKERKFDTATKDKHGNTPLHLAVMLGREVCIYLLLRYGASVRTRNSAGWSPVDEAVSYGNRDTILLLRRTFYQQFRDDMVQKRTNLLNELRNTGNFYVKLKWNLHSYWPGLSRVLPSDTYELYKQGLTVKLDTSLHHFNPLLMRWERATVSFIFHGATPKPFILQIDHSDKTVGRILETPKTEKKLHSEVDRMMSGNILSFTMLTDQVTITKAQSSGLFGLGRSKDKTETFGPYKADFYNINGLVFVQHKRCEHLSPEQIKYNNERNPVEILANGLDLMILFRAKRKIPKAPLSPVPINTVTWAVYINSKSGEPPTLGRPRNPTKTKLSITPEIATVSGFPIDRELVVDLLEAVAPFKHFAYLRDFMKILPQGFPIQLDVPIKASISAKYTFLKCQLKNIPDHVFLVPPGFQPALYEPEDAIFF